MKQERLLAKYSLFQSDTLEEQYNKMKAAFVVLLNRTTTRCSKHCDHRNDQERYASMCHEAVPGLNERRAMIESSLGRVQHQLDIIDTFKKVDEKIAAFKAYAKGLAESEFKALFMVILSGELRKRWLCITEEASLPPKIP